MEAKILRIGKYRTHALGYASGEDYLLFEFCDNERSFAVKNTNANGVSPAILKDLYVELDANGVMG